VLGINLQEDKDTILKFLKNQKINYTVLLSDKKVVSNYKIRSIPAFFIIDQNGEIYNKYVGYAPGMEENWKKDIEKILN
jgi:thioredoxin-related protein